MKVFAASAARQILTESELKGFSSSIFLSRVHDDLRQSLKVLRKQLPAIRHSIPSKCQDKTERLHAK